MKAASLAVDERPSRVCETFADPSGPRTCGRPAVARLRVFCVHEHARDLAVCSGDAASVGTEWGWCRACYQHPERSHWCQLRVVEVSAT